MSRLSAEYVTSKRGGNLEDQRVGLGPRTGSALAVAMEHVFLMCSHLGRLLCEFSFTAVHPIQAALPTCSLLHGVLARHGEVIRSLGSSVKEIESRVERRQILIRPAFRRTGGGAGLGWPLSKRSPKPDTP